MGQEEGDPPTGFADGSRFLPLEAPREQGRRSPPAPLDAAGLLIPAPGRERLLSPEAGGLSDQELLELLLSFVLPVDPAPLAAAALGRFGSFAAILSAAERELRAVPGLGTHCIAAIKLVQAAALRLARAEVMAEPVLDNWDQLMRYLNAVLGREKIEQFRILFLDGASRLLADEAQARGTVNHTPVYPREVVKRSLELGATGLILVHNHPSGDPTPSPDDLAMTKQVKAAAETLGIALQDHVIVGNGRWLSLRREALL